MMHRTALAVVLSLVVALAAPAAAASLGAVGSADGPSAASGTIVAQTQENNTTENDTDTVQPGEQLAGVVSVQGAEVSGEVEERAFGHRIAAARSNASKASVVADETGSLETRLDELAAEKQALQAKYENGTITTGQYKARMAKLVAETRTIERLLNTTAATATTIPADDLKAAGVDVQKIDMLRTNAKNLTGPEVAAIATEIAGKNVGKAPPGLQNRTPGVPGNVTVGPPGNVSTGQGNGPGNGQAGSGGGQDGAPDNVTNGNGTEAPGQGNAPGNVTNGNGSAPVNGSAPGNASDNGTDASSLLVNEQSFVERIWTDAVSWLLH